MKTDDLIRIHCEYCKGMTYDDSKGNCSACGAPRTEENYLSGMSHLHRHVPIRGISVEYNPKVCGSTDSPW